MFAQQQQLPHFTPKGRAGKAPRGNNRQLMAAHGARLAAQRMLPADAPFPTFGNLIGANYFPYLAAREAYLGGSPGPRYF